MARPSASRAKGLVGGVTQFLLGQPKTPVYQALSVRAGAPPPRALGPRDTRVLPGPITFEWSGPPRSDYRVQLLGPQGPVWEQSSLPRRPLAYPAAAPAAESRAPATAGSWRFPVRPRSAPSSKSSPSLMRLA